MTLEQKNFVIKLLDECGPDDNEKWLSIIRYGMATLLCESLFLNKLIVDRAIKLHDHHMLVHGVAQPEFTYGEMASRLMFDLKLSFKLVGDVTATSRHTI